jgi:hypothetical protein
MEHHDIRKKLNFDIQNDHYYVRRSLKILIHTAFVYTIINYMTDMPIRKNLTMTSIIMIIFIILELYLPSIKLDVVLRN